MKENQMAARTPKMKQAQRVVIVVYLLAVAYCFLWVPWCIHWHVPSDSYKPPALERVGYGWLWAGPRYAPRPQTAAPDSPMIGMCLVAVTATCGAAYLVLALEVRLPTHQSETTRE